MTVTALRALLAAAALLLACSGWAERMQPMGSYEAHYSLVPTLLLKADVVARYGISRGRDRALLNVSVLDADGQPVRATVTGIVRDLLGQQRDLGFREVVEGEAVYYLAGVRHDDREVLRFAIRVTTPDGRVHPLEFQQKMYWEGR